MPGTVLGTGDTQLNKDPRPHRPYSLRIKPRMPSLHRPWSSQTHIYLQYSVMSGLPTSGEGRPVHLWRGEEGTGEDGERGKQKPYEPFLGSHSRKRPSALWVPASLLGVQEKRLLELAASSRGPAQRHREFQPASQPASSSQPHSVQPGTRVPGNLFSLSSRQRARQEARSPADGAFCAGCALGRTLPLGKSPALGEEAAERELPGLSSQEITPGQKWMAALLFFWRKKKRTRPFPTCRS